MLSQTILPFPGPFLSVFSRYSMQKWKRTEDNMKFAILRVTTMLAVVVALAALSAQAQTVLNKEKFTVPFQFNVGNEVLPAGEYTVYVENQTIRLQKSDGNANAIALSTHTVHASETNREVKLTFRQFGERVYLSQVWLNDGVGRELKRQRRQNTDLAQNVSVLEVQAQAR